MRRLERIYPYLLVIIAGYLLLRILPTLISNH